jgi:hypothetical protein
MKMREWAFSSAALEKVENERRIGDESLQVLPGSNVVLQSWKPIRSVPKNCFNTSAPKNCFNTSAPAPPSML